jgi:hypothetical protein
MSWTDDTPNPGSDAAKQAGCLCPVLDNCHGRRAPWPGGCWWVRPDCPMHGGDQAKEPAR